MLRCMKQQVLSLKIMYCWSWCLEEYRVVACSQSKQYEANNRYFGVIKTQKFSNTEKKVTFWHPKLIEAARVTNCNQQRCHLGRITWHLRLISSKYCIFSLTLGSIWGGKGSPVMTTALPFMSAKSNPSDTWYNTEKEDDRKICRFNKYSFQSTKSKGENKKCTFLNQNKFPIKFKTKWLFSYKESFDRNFLRGSLVSELHDFTLIQWNLHIFADKIVLLGCIGWQHFTVCVVKENLKRILKRILY